MAEKRADWKAYRFEDVPLLTAERTGSLQELAKLLPGEESARALRSGVGAVLQKLQEPGDEAGGEETESLLVIGGAGPADEVHAPLGEKMVVRFFVSLGGNGEEAFLETSLESARSLIGRVAGVSEERLGASDLLSDIEKGFLGYFAERIVSGIAESEGYGAQLAPISLTGLGCESGAPDWGEAGPSGWHALTGTVKLAGANLPFRLLLPVNALKAARKRFEAGSDYAAGAGRRASRLARDLGDCHVVLVGRLGEVHLTAEELTKVEPNDMVLFESGNLMLDEGRLSGLLRLSPEGAGSGGPSVMANTESSSPVMHSSTTTSRPASPNRKSSIISRRASRARSSVWHTMSPFPAARPEALTTIGAPRSRT